MLILNRKQFGYHSDTYYYCKYLNNKFDITYLCWDYGLKRPFVEKVNVKYVSRKGNKLVRYFRFLFAAISEVTKGYDICFIKYFLGCSLLKLLNFKGNFVFDIRTAHTWDNPLKRNFFDALLIFESLFFDKITIISKGLACRLKIPRKKVHILPLGADSLSNKDKKIDKMKLLYVGTFKNRNIADTIVGFEKFYKKYRSKIEIEYKIIGSGTAKEEQKLATLARDMNIEKVIEFVGFVPHSDLISYFDMNNIGVSFVPITKYFDKQPPTKTFEYALSGMPVIATNTTENRKVISDTNGVIIPDTAEGFYEGLKVMFDRRRTYVSSDIRKTCTEFKWENLVNKNLQIYLESMV